MSSTLTTGRDAEVANAPRRARTVLDYLLLAELRWALLAVVLFALGGILELAGAPAAVWWTAYLLCYVAGGWEPALAGLTALRSRTLDVDLLMVVAAVVAAVIGQVLDGALLIVIFATSGALEAIATKRTRDSVSALLDLAPEGASLVDGGAERRVDSTELAVGDVIRVRPGERVAADGEVIDGSSELDQSSITGESMPVVATVGGSVYAGTMNGTGTLLVRVAVPAGRSVLARIVALVKQASETKASAQLFIERVEQRYSVAMVTATLLLFVVPLILGHELRPTLLRAMTFMIVASPCAIVLATMPPLLSAIANAGRHGVLVKSAVVMERLGESDAVAFDKTGTLTMGTPEVVRLVPAPDATLTPATALRLAAAAERPSQHPLAAAIVAAQEQRDSSAGSLHAVGFRSIPGVGVSATVDGRRVRVVAPDADAPADLVTDLAAHGGTVVVVEVDDGPQLLVELSDRVREGAADAVAELGTLLEQPATMVTGDNPKAATALAARVGIADVRAGLLPEDKVAVVAELERAGRRVVVVGDGVNDAPALAAAHVGAAMGRRGTDLALDTADAVIVRDDLTTLARVIALSRRAHRVVVANLVVAFAVVVGLVVWDLVGHLPLPLGVAGHEGSTVVVGLNGLRLLRGRAWRRPATRRRLV